MSDISVIIPVKNRATLLRKTLDNLLSQSKKPDEIIVIDDHSTDEIKLVIFDYITDCIFLNNKGIGPGAARNLGLTVATGRYIQFFDSDDLMTHKKLETQFHALEQTGAHMAYGPYVQAIENENATWSQKDVVMQAFPMPEGRNLTAWLLRGWNAITQSCLFRHEWLKNCPPWNEKWITHEDYLYLFHLSLQQPKMVHVPEEGVIYRQHALQSTDINTNHGSRAADKMEVLIEIKSQLPSISIDVESNILFRGRMAQNYQFLKTQGIDPRRYSGFMHPLDFIYGFYYRFYNRQMRQKTGSGWEPMHGIDKRPEAFQQLIQKFGTTHA